ncbi:hypothetical protein AXE80_08290 [Wenyingzhuangia fucanilytica]|uniref:Transcription termination factor Rho n=1 Tax=Wenyingzhuangia fucanilytica TaxID=1790137 RepID=A0A1B1Y6A4_9FLAO|nr:DUF4293 domain-containing protein [Wenyingzhuangia fucanilytica]ANW96277.1 hypothetical protein AXE80_08290 [Wenyingzhuangia fucanilytica]
MIQRIQTLYLLSVFVITGVLTNFFSFFTLNDGVSLFLTNTIMYNSVLVKSVGVFFVLSALMSLVAVFSYKKRQNQFVVNRLNILINFYLLSVLMYLSLTLSGETQISEKGIGIYFPIVNIVLLVMANKAIRKDEDLVKSVDRLR